MKRRITTWSVAVSLICSVLLQFSLPSAEAGAYDARFTGITPNSSSLVSWAVAGGGFSLPGNFIFDSEGNAWGITNAGTGQCISKITPNSDGSSGSVSSIYGASGTCPALQVTEGAASYQILGTTGGGAWGLAWIDSTHLGIGTSNGIFSWDISSTPSTSSLVKISSAFASRIAIDGNQNVYAVQSSSGSAVGSQTRVKRFSLLKPSDSSTVFASGDNGLTCSNIDHVVVSVSGYLYISCNGGGLTTVKVDLATGTKSLLSDFASGPLAVDASGNIYIVGVLAAFDSSPQWPTITKLSPSGVVQSYWNYGATGDRTEVAIDLAGNIYSLNGGGNIISKLLGTSIPFAPTRITASASASSAVVSWFKPGVTGLETYTATASPGGQYCVTVWPSASCTISGLTNGSSYSISVQAPNRNGSSASSASVNVIPLSVPDSPTAASAVLASSTTVLFSFSAPANNGGSVIESYTVTSTPDSVTAFIVGADSGSATLSGLRPGVTYSFGVQAGNSRGLSATSNLLSLKIPKSPVFNTWANVNLNKSVGTYSIIPPVESETASGSFTYSSSNPLIVSISGGTANILQSGSAVITATFTPSDTSTYLSGITKSMTITVSAASNAITFGSPGTKVVTAGAFNLSATATGGTVTYATSSSSTICTVSNSGYVQMFSPGSCAIKASSVGNATYGAATDVTQTLTITAAPPGAPALTSVSVGGTDAAVSTSGYATLQFTANTENGGSITSYTLTATPGIGSTRTSTVTAASGTRSGTITGLTLGTSYTFTVTAYNGGTTGGGNSASSNSLSKTPSANPYAPTALRVTSGNTTLVANWTPPVSIGGGVFDSYQVYIKASADSSWGTAISIGTQATSTYTFTGLTNGTAYDVKIWVKTNLSLIETPNTSTAVYLIPATVPAAPRMAISQTDSSTITASWASNGDGGSALTGYTITLSSGSCSFSFVSGTTSYTCPITGVTPGSSVSATLVATNAIGTSDISTASPLTFVSTVGAPNSLVATNGDSQASIAFATSSNGDTVVSYDYSFDGSSFMPAAATSSPILITGLTNGVTYNIYLRAKGAINGNGAASTAVSVTPRVAPSSTGPAPVVLGPPPSTFVVVSNPKISRSGTSYVCTSGTYKFKKQGGKEEASSITSQQISLLSNGAVVDSEKTLEPQSTFEGKSSYKGTTLSCEVGIKQEEVVKTYSSIDPAGIASYEAAMTSAIYGANTTYYSERDAAYLKRDSGETKLWKEMLDKALLKREDTKVQAGVDYLANLEKAGISLVVAADKSAPTPSPTPTPTPTPTKSPEVSVTGNVQPVEMKLIGSIYFASGTYFLNDEAKKTIKALATSIFLRAPTQVLSYGFTDSKGGADNTVLSQNRAKAVAKFLRSFLPGQKIATGWYASSKPVATGTSKAALAKNRRVEIYIK